MTLFDVTHAKELLQVERATLVDQLTEMGSSESGDLRTDLDFGDGFADAGAATAERTELLGVVESLKAQLDGVDAALARIEEGMYGTCKSCGKEIPAARLEARPASILCVECKSQRP